MKHEFKLSAAVACLALSWFTSDCSAGNIAFQNAPAPQLVYLNRCIGGCPIQLGNDDAVNRKSSIVNGSVTAPAFAYSDDTYNQIVACTRSVLEPFNIRLTAYDPGNLPRDEVVLTTTSTSVGLQSGIASVSPYSGAYEPNTLSFVFANIFAGGVDGVCWATATEIGHLYGLDRVAPCADMMSFATGCGEKAFTNADSACDGTAWGTPGKCFSGATTQNSYAILTSIAGPVDTLFAQGFEAWESPHSGPSP